jgi:hypothetical protein
MQDLSNLPLAKTSLWVSSMSGGNTTSSNANAMSAPGSVPVDPMPNAKDAADPTVGPMQDVPLGSPPRRIDDSFSPSPVSWKETPSA